MERRDLYQDDLTEERYPSPARRNDEAATEVLDPDASTDDGPVAKMPGSDVAGRSPLGYPHGVPGGLQHDPDEVEDDEDDEDEEDDEEDEDLD